ncbi:MAG TPA: hypothetical protein VGK74_19155 [Symbiobacteriaceae bacterium]
MVSPVHAVLNVVELRGAEALAGHSSMVYADVPTTQESPDSLRAWVASLGLPEDYSAMQPDRPLGPPAAADTAP